ncbi:hypothetical protein EHS25_001244 [Saitozyma podzolica]|uniref:Uncharacterized protein n=1 Tax=Saitozyma podzolica TaxID=1890683 RepID=A0A427YHS8_9TREE|nr:hypothetical protein EHS25_001244 [Saitozyma podzolica]
MSTDSATPTTLSAVPKLRGNANYIEWREAIEEQLLAHDLLDIVEGTEEEPFGQKGVRKRRAGSVMPTGGTGDPGDAPKALSAVEVKQWKDWSKRESKAQAWLRMTCTEGPKRSIMGMLSAHEMWSHLENTHMVRTIERQGQLLQTLASFRLLSANSKAMTTHMESFLVTLSRYETAGGILPESQQIVLFLNSLPAAMEQWKDTYAALDEYRQTWVELERLWNRKVEDKERYETSKGSHSNGDALATHGGNHGQKGKKTGEKKEKKQRDMSKVKCWTCEKTGHFKRDCPDAENSSKKDKTDGQANAAVEAEFEAFVGQAVQDATGLDSEWVIDSGATHHLSGDPKVFASRSDLPEPFSFSLAGQGSLTAEQMGEVPLRLPSGHGLSLQDVYFTPSARLNLLSASRLLSRGWTISLAPSGGRISNGKVDVPLEKRKGLWVLTAKSANQATHGRVLVTTGAESLHAALGHIRGKKLEDAAAQAGLKVADVMRSAEGCSTCAEAKATKQPKAGTSPRGAYAGELVHVDIAGPFQPAKAGEDHFLALVDDWSKISLVVPMGGKTEAYRHLRAFVSIMARLAAPRAVRFVRSDGGGEFGSLEAQAWYRETGIQHQVSPPYTPELNGVVERFMRTAKEMITAMLKGSALPHEYWTHAARHAACIIMKTTKVQGKTAWERLTGREPTLPTSRVFGQSITVAIPRAVRTKGSLTNARGVRGTLLGQRWDRVGWIVELEDGKVIETKEVSKTTTSAGDSGITGGWRHMGAIPVSTPQTDTVRLPSTSFDTNDSDLDNGSVGDEGTRETATSKMGPKNIATQPTATSAPPRIRHGWTYEVRTPETQRNAIEVEILPTRTRSGRTGNSGEANWLNWQGPEAEEHHLASSAAMALVMTNLDDEPANPHEAKRTGEAKQWLEAMASEIANIESKGTWREVVVPENRTPIGVRWVFKRKRDEKGQVVRWKARIVAKGYSQVPGVDFEQTYAPVGRTTSLRILLTLAAQRDLELRQADVEGAYLNGTLEEEIYMAFPEGYKPKNDHATGLRLVKSLYGLKQSGRAWWIELGTALAGVGFKKLESDWGLYYRTATSDYGEAFLLAYVDDILIAATASKTIDHIMAALKDRWKMTEMGEVRMILGMRVDRDRPSRTVTLSQPAYVDKLLERFTPSGKKRSTPLAILKRLGPEYLAAAKEEKEAGGAGGADKVRYQEIVGSLQWIATCTRPDLAFAASWLARYTSAPTAGHLKVALEVIDHLGSTRNMRLTLGGKTAKAELEGWVDADWGGCHDTRRSTTGHIFMLGGSAIVWTSRRQATVASSTVEAEYVAVSEAAREAVWLKGLLDELGVTPKEPTPLWCDNQGAIRLARNPGTHRRTKHIAIRWHLIRELIEDGVVRLGYVPTASQVADIFTKALLPAPHRSLRASLGLVLDGEDADLEGSI